MKSSIKTGLLLGLALLANLAQAADCPRIDRKSVV